MKKVRCPKCDNYTIFDETKYQEGQSLVFQCPNCGKQFGIRLDASKLIDKKIINDSEKDNSEEKPIGFLIVIENVFGFRQELPLVMGDNVIGRYQKGHDIQCSIESSDPSMDMHHCVLTVQRGKNNSLKFILSDGPSYTGTFVGGEILGNREKRVIEDGSLFTIGATSIILRLKEEK